MSERCLSPGVPLPLTYADPNGTETLLYWAVLEKEDWAGRTVRLAWQRGFWLWLLRVGWKKMPCVMDGW